MSIPESEWVWCGYPGHLVASASCRFHMNTRVGDWRISTVGDYFPSSDQKQIGLGTWHETAIVAVVGHGQHGEGEVSGDYWIEPYSEKSSDGLDERHMEWCRKVAAGWTPDAGGDA